MQCDNCGYIFFQPSKKCSCCGAPYVPAQSSFDVGQENLFTIFEMAPGEGGIPGGMGMAGSVAGDDYQFTDDFDTGGAEYGVDENVLDLSDAEAEGFGVGPVSEPVSADDFEFDTSAMDDMPSRDDVGPDDFELNLSEDIQADEPVATEEAPELDAGSSTEMDFTGGFDEVEGLGFGFDETPAEETSEAPTDEITLDAAPEPEIDAEPEISLEPELELADEEPSLEVSEEPELEIGDDQPSLELSDEPSMDLPEELTADLPEELTADLPEEVTADTDEMNAVEEEPSLGLPEDLELSEEPELIEPTEDEYGDVDDDSGIEFDLDSVDLDEPEEVTYVEEPEAETGSAEEPFMDLEGLEMETPEDSEDENLKQ